MEMEQDPPLLAPLPFAFNHSLVVQRLTTPKPIYTTMNNTKGPNQNLRKGAQQQLQRKQNRRRLHTSRPYQERLLNMAEARREIVTALKHHRAAKRQASEEQQPQQQQQQQQQSSLPLQTSHVSSFDQDGRFNSRRHPRIYPSYATKLSNYMHDFSHSSFHPPPNSYPNTSHVTSPIFAHPPPKVENPNFTLPNQALGLNLNVHHFNSLQAPLILNNNNNNNNNNNDNTNSSLCSYSSPTSPSPPLVTDQDVPSVVTPNSQGEGVSSVVDTIESNATTHFTRDMHIAMDDEDMAEIRSLGEQHQMEWNDTMSFITSAWWFNCLKNMEHGATHEVKTEDGASQIFDELNELPSWLNINANDGWLEHCSEDYFQDPTLPCL